MDNVLVAKRMNARLKRGVRAHAVVVLLLCALTACSSEPAEDIGTEAEVPAQTDWNIASQNHRCDPSVREKVIELGIDPDSVKGISTHRREVRRRTNNRVRRQQVGYTAWVRTHDQSGNLVMDLFLNCRVQRYYTRGGFALPGDYPGVRGVLTQRRRNALARIG